MNNPSQRDESDVNPTQRRERDGGFPPEVGFNKFVNNSYERFLKYYDEFRYYIDNSEYSSFNLIYKDIIKMAAEIKLGIEGQRIKKSGGFFPSFKQFKLTTIDYLDKVFPEEILVLNSLVNTGERSFRHRLNNFEIPKEGGTISDQRLKFKDKMNVELFNMNRILTDLRVVYDNNYKKDLENGRIQERKFRIDENGRPVAEVFKEEFEKKVPRRAKSLF